MQLLKDLVAFVKTEKCKEILGWLAFVQCLVVLFSAMMTAYCHGRFPFVVVLIAINLSCAIPWYVQIQSLVNGFKWFRREKSNGKA